MSMLIYLEEPHVVHNLRYCCFRCGRTAVSSAGMVWVYSTAAYPLSAREQSTVREGPHLHQHRQYIDSHQPVQASACVWQRCHREILRYTPQQLYGVHYIANQLWRV